MSHSLPLQCPSCGLRLEYDHDSCPACLEPISQQDVSVQEADAFQQDISPSGGMKGVSEDIPPDEPLKTIARFGNAAEAGFFAHALQSIHNIPAWIRAEDNFDALSGFWSTHYHLVVPGRRAEASLRILQSLLEQTEGEEGHEFFPAEESERTADSQPFSLEEQSLQSGSATLTEPLPPSEGQGRSWAPLVLTLAAGSLALVGYRAWQPAAPPRPDVAGKRQQEMWEALSRPQRPWIQHVEGQHWRVLQFSPDRSKLILREYDGPQQISQKEFTLAPAE